jgi:restriction system protein
LGRRRESSPLDDTFGLLKLAPFWAGPVLAIATFASMRYAAPLLFPAPEDGIDTGVIVRSLLPMLAWLLAAVIIVVWVAAEFQKFSDRRLLDRQTGATSIRDLPWREFERLVCEAYRRKGYVAQGVGTASADGGVDIELSRPGDKVVVQCKQWRAYTVGVTTVRELLGIVVSTGATKGIVVTSGRFTREARRFAEQNPQVELVDGPQLARLISAVQQNQRRALRNPVTEAVSAAQAPTPCRLWGRDGPSCCAPWHECGFTVLGMPEVPGVPRDAPVGGCGGIRTGAARMTTSEAYFESRGDDDADTFVIKLVEESKIAHARAILAGTEQQRVHVQGTIISEKAPYNAAWSYHLKPESIEFFEWAIEVCDSTMRYVEENLKDVGGAFLPKAHWCPWNSKLTSEIPAPQLPK